MTLDEQRARAERFQAWYERDGLKEAIDAIHATYIARMSDVQPWETDKLQVLAIAAKVARQVEQEVVLAMAEGQAAKSEIARINRIEALPTRKRKLLGL